MCEALGTVFELSVRFLLILHASQDHTMSVRRLCSIDFMTTYACDFGMSLANINGFSSYSFGEYASRCAMSDEAIRRLAMNGLVTITAVRDGFAYEISETGKRYCDVLDSIYSDDYLLTAHVVLSTTRDLDDEAIHQMINRVTVDSIERRR